MKLLSKENYNTESKFYKDYDLVHEVVVVNTKDSIKQFDELNHKFCNLAKTSCVYLGIDFEFNSQVIALMQLSYEIKDQNYIYVIHPPSIPEIELKYFIENVLINPEIKKILHGADSLDMPYLVNKLLAENKEYIYKFFLNFIDTKFLCDYNSMVCKIYHFILDLKLIDQKHFDWLNSNEDKFEVPISQMNIDINDLSKEMLIYAIYDVYYLKSIFLSFNTDDRKMISEIGSFVLMNRYNILSYHLEYNTLVGTMNNYYFFENGIYHKLINVFKDLDFSKFKIFKINYFRKILLVFVKLIIYADIINNKKVFQAKGVIARFENNFIQSLIEKKFLYTASFYKSIYDYYKNKNS